MPGDSTGLSDPFVEMYCAGQTVQTGKEDKMGTLNPIWY